MGFKMGLKKDWIGGVKWVLKWAWMGGKKGFKMGLDEGQKGLLKRLGWGAKRDSK